MPEDLAVDAIGLQIPPHRIHNEDRVLGPPRNGRRAEKPVLPWTAAQARKAGDAGAAKEIAALGKPTRSAWLVNRLVRADPSVPGRLAELASQLNEMPALDAAAIRQLTVARRQLVDSLVRDAIKDPDGPAPSAALRDEPVLHACASCKHDFRTGLPAQELWQHIDLSAAAPTSATTPAAWYPDPYGAAQLRWWDGSAWTGFIN